jgi:transposase InsO family protein
MYSGGCLFVDHATNHIELQAHLTNHETLKAKGAYELMCRDHSVVPQSYLSDNGSAFTSGDFSKRLAAFEQVILFAGVGDHHSNGNSERSIQTVMSIARTMMLHATIHRPDLADAAQWPMAVAHAVWLCKQSCSHSRNWTIISTRSVHEDTMGAKHVP